MYGYIYETTNLTNNKKYIGCKKSDKFLGNKYLGSGTLIKRAITKYGKDNFSVRLIEECNSYEELADKEIYYINYYNAVKDDNYYNLSVGSECKKGYATRGSRRNEEFKRQASIRNKGKVFGNEESHRKMRETLRNKVWVTNNKEEKYINKEEVAEYENKGYIKGRLPMKDSQKYKCSESHKEFIKNNPDRAYRISSNRKGKPNPRKGTQFNISDEQRESWSRQRKGRIWVHNESSKTQIFKEQLQEYLNKGYHKGMYKDKCQICSSTTIESID